MKLLYLHGLGSGAESRTPRTLRVLLPDDEIFAPEIPIDPIEAYDYVLRYHLLLPAQSDFFLDILK